MQHPEKTPTPRLLTAADCEHSDQSEQKLIEQYDLQKLHEYEVDKQLKLYKQIIHDFPGWPTETKLATIACILSLEDQYGLDHICAQLRSLVVRLAEYLVDRKTDFPEKEDILCDMRMLHAIAREFDWIRNHGCCVGYPNEYEY